MCCDRDLDEGLAESVSSLIWAAPRLQTDVAELKIIADQLTLKFGKPYGQVSDVVVVVLGLQGSLGEHYEPW